MGCSESIIEFIFAIFILELFSPLNIYRIIQLWRSCFVLSCSEVQIKHLWHLLWRFCCITGKCQWKEKKWVSVCFRMWYINIMVLYLAHLVLQLNPLRQTDTVQKTLLDKLHGFSYATQHTDFFCEYTKQSLVCHCLVNIFFCTSACWQLHQAAGDWGLRDSHNIQEHPVWLMQHLLSGCKRHMHEHEPL